jgi:hypothetical protein
VWLVARGGGGGPIGGGLVGGGLAGGDRVGSVGCAGACHASTGEDGALLWCAAVPAARPAAASWAIDFGAVGHMAIGGYRDDDDDADADCDGMMSRRVVFALLGKTFCSNPNVLTVCRVIRSLRLFRSLGKHLNAMQQSTMRKMRLKNVPNPAGMDIPIDPNRSPSQPNSPPPDLQCGCESVGECESVGGAVGLSG